jgi:prepilin-type N-terminal cleavage/methylation domain-containing protein
MALTHRSAESRGASSALRRAFTLIELLVAITIIALLISILLPSLKKAREQAKTVLCISNIKNIALASITYANADRGGNCIPIHPLTGEGAMGDVGSYDWGGKSGIGEPQQSNRIVASIWGTMYGRGPATRPLNSIIYKSLPTDYVLNPGLQQVNWIADTKLKLDVYRCPSDRGYTGHHFRAWEESKLSSYDHYGNSYAANTLWCNSHSGLCVVKSWGPLFRPLTRVPNPANTVYYIENCGRFAWRTGGVASRGARSQSSRMVPAADRGSSYPWNLCWTQSDGPHFSQSAHVDVIKDWHTKEPNFVTAFLDGHAGLVKITGFLWPPPSTPRDPDGDPLLWECHVIRGIGWQLDVLPSMPIYHWVRCDLPNWPANTLQ